MINITKSKQNLLRDYDSTRECLNRDINGYDLMKKEIELFLTLIVVLPGLALSMLTVIGSLAMP